MPGARKTAASSSTRNNDVLTTDQQQQIADKIDLVEQQVRIIRAMIQKPDLCSEILNNLAQAEESLNGVGLAVLQMHVATCVPAGMETSDEEGRNRLAELVDIFDRFAK